jgi:hypothetical protein
MIIGACESEGSLSQDLMKTVCMTFQSNVEEGTKALIRLASDSGFGERIGLPAGFISTTVRALRTNDWSEVGSAFANKEFIGGSGLFLLIGPYMRQHCATPSLVLTGVYGRVIPAEPAPHFSSVIAELFGQAEEIDELVSFHCLASFGHADADRGEAFLVPDAWAFCNNKAGPALNNMTFQQQRMDRCGDKYLSSVFSAPSREFLTRSLANPAAATMIRHREFQFHEAGHAAGLGLHRKLSMGVLPTAWHRGVEEWRADGVEFELLARMLPAERAGEAIAANYCLRFGVDAHRRGQIEEDTDVVAALLCLDSLLAGGSLYIDVDRKLRFKDESFTGLIDASERHRSNALQFTIDESSAGFEDRIQMLYGSLPVERSTRVIFEGLIRNASRDTC